MKRLMILLLLIISTTAILYGCGGGGGRGEQPAQGTGVVKIVGGSNQ